MPATPPPTGPLTGATAPHHTAVREERMERLANGAAPCRWCGCQLEELPSGQWVDVLGSSRCAEPRPGLHWPQS